MLLIEPPLQYSQYRQSLVDSGEAHLRYGDSFGQGGRPVTSKPSDAHRLIQSLVL